MTLFIHLPEVKTETVNKGMGWVERSVKTPTIAHKNKTVQLWDKMTTGKNKAVVSLSTSVVADILTGNCSSQPQMNS